jgi:hypothetical protein
VKPYTAGESARLAQAKALLEKHGYSATNKLKVNLHWGGPTNQRRVDTAALMVAAAAKVGIEIVSKPDATWSQNLYGKAGQDMEFYAWSQTSTLYNSLLNIYGNVDGKARDQNSIGWINATVERNLKRHQDEALTADQAFKVNNNFEKQYFKDAVGLPLFQWASVVAATKTLKNVKPSALSPQVVWNYWEWTY